jgi:hypothetical protein
MYSMKGDINVRMTALLDHQFQTIKEYLIHDPNAAEEELDNFLYNLIHDVENDQVPETNVVRIKQGDWLKALYTDGLWYDAKVHKILSRGRYSVVFDGYEDTKEIVHHENVERIPTADEIEKVNNDYYNKKLKLLNHAPTSKKLLINGSRSTTLLHTMAKMGHNYIIQWLLDNDANLENRDHGGYTPFMIACKNGRLNVVKLLLHYGASYKKRTFLTKQSGYDLAKYHNHEEIIQYFEEQTNLQESFEKYNATSTTQYH